jgi:hypothetical protein
MPFHRAQNLSISRTHPPTTCPMYHSAICNHRKHYARGRINHRCINSYFIPPSPSLTPIEQRELSFREGVESKADVFVHGPKNYKKDTKPKMLSLLLFNKVYRLGMQSVMLVFSEEIGLCGEHAYTGVIHCVFHQRPNLQNCFSTPNQNQRGEGLRQIDTCRQVPLQVNF